jgi:hypothetical protein
MNLAGLLLNRSNGRFHPIVFRPYPMPGGIEASRGTERRYKSWHHHTEGFATKDEAIADIKTHGWVWTEQEWEWNGDGIPALTGFFTPPQREADAPSNPAST